MPYSNVQYNIPGVSAMNSSRQVSSPVTWNISGYEYWDTLCTHIHSKFECHFKKFSVELNDNGAPLFHCGGGATSLNVDSSIHEADQSVLPLTIL